MKLTAKQLTAAYARFARRYGYYVRTIRTSTSLSMQARIEYINEVRAFDAFEKAAMQ